MLPGKVIQFLNIQLEIEICSLKNYSSQKFRMKMSHFLYQKMTEEQISVCINLNGYEEFCNAYPTYILLKG